MSISDILVGVNSSALNVPLNHTNWLLDYKINGTKSYVYKDKDILHELYRSPISANDEDIQTEALNFIIDNDPSIVLRWVAKEYELKSYADLLLEKTSFFDTVTDYALMTDMKASGSSLYKSFIENTKVKEIRYSTDALNKYSLNNDFITFMESDSVFTSSVSSNSDKQTASATGSSNATTLNNVFVISAYRGIIIATMPNGVNYQFGGSISGILHGTDDSTTVVGSCSWASGQSNITVTPCKFYKSFTITPISVTDRSNQVVSSTCSITYIQLDNVV